MKIIFLKRMVGIGVLMSFSLFSYAYAADAAKKEAILDPSAGTNSIYMNLQEKKNQLRQQIQLIELQQAQVIFNTIQKNKTPTNLWWEEVKSNILPKSVINFSETANNPQYICRSHFLDNIYPGQVVKDSCLITYNGKTLLQKNYEVLVGTQKVKWVDPNLVSQYNFMSAPIASFPIHSNVVISSRTETPYQPIYGGEENNQRLLICRSLTKNDWHIGKVVAGRCNIAYNNIEVPVDNYQVLTYFKELI